MTHYTSAAVPLLAKMVKIIRVCVIGAGAAGLAAARHLTASPQLFSTTVFEQTATLGGTWVYSEQTGQDEYGLPIHSSMYKNLLTNLPKEVMRFPDFSFPKGEHSFIHHSEVLQYLKDYASHFNLYPYIQFCKYVRSVTPKRNSKGELSWEIIVKDVQTKEEIQYVFDAVMVCNGHYSVPAVPKIQGIDTFKGTVLHSHDYREPKSFVGKRVVVLGAAASGADICQEIATVTSPVYLSHNLPQPLSAKLHPNVIQVKGIVSANENGFELVDGTKYDADAIIFCTGYEYTFPFLSPECNVTVEDRQVKPLYKHMIHIEYPSMCFIGIPWKTCPFPQFDTQTRFFISILNGSCILPSNEEMLKDNENHLVSLLVQGMPHRYFHKQGLSQWRYNEELATMANLEKLPEIFEHLYAIVARRRREDLYKYKQDVYEITSTDTVIVKTK